MWRLVSFVFVILLLGSLLVMPALAASGILGDQTVSSSSTFFVVDPGTCSVSIADGFGADRIVTDLSGFLGSVQQIYSCIDIKLEGL